MTNSDYLKDIKEKEDIDNEGISLADYDLREIRALEIIAEELCKLNRREDNRFRSGD